MKLPEKARAVKGRPIPPTWEALQAFADAPEPRPRGTRVRELPGETLFFTPRPVSPWGHPWRAALSGRGAAVAPGLVNATMPRAGRDLLTLDGADETGAPTGRRPEIELTDGAGDDGRSFLCVRLLVTADGEAAIEDEPLRWLTVVHRPALPVGYQSGLMPSVVEDGYEVGYFPLTVLYWTGNRIARLLPCAHHHLQHRFVAGAERPGGGRYPNRHDWRI